MPVELSERTTIDRRVITTEQRPKTSQPLLRQRRTWFRNWGPVVLAASMAVSIVTFAERFEPTSPAPVEAPSSVEATPADVSITPATREVTATDQRPSAEPLGPPANVVAALAVDGMSLRLAAGTASIAVGDSAPIELTTTRIGDLVVADAPAPIVEQRDAEAVHVWPDVTEWYRPLESAFEHGYTIEQPVHAGDTLIVDVAVAGAEAVGVDGDVMFARDGEAPLWYRDLHVFDAAGTTLPAAMSAAGTTITFEVATAGATYPITIDPTIAEDQRVLPTAAGDRIGEVVAADGNTVAVAARLNDDLGVDVGAVHVYANPGGGWVFQQTVYPAVSTSTDFGWSLDLRGDTLVVGAPGDDANGVDSGAVYVFTRSGAVWSLDDVAYPCAVAANPCGQSTGGAFGGYRFGEAVALTGDEQVMVVGAPGGGASGEGSAYLYEPWPSTVGPVAAGAWATNDGRDLVVGGLLPGDRFGAAVDIDGAGEHIVVGAPRFDNGAVVNAGGAWWFGRPGGSLSGVAGLNAGGGDVTGGDYGSAVAIMRRPDGDAIVLVAQPIVTRDGVDTPGSGQNKFVFWRIPNASTTPSVRQTFTGIPNELWAFGQAVDADGSRFAVGRPLQNNFGAVSGEVVVLPWNDGTESVDFDLDTVHKFVGAVDPGDRYGSAVAVAGDVVVGGAPFRSSQRGGAAISSIATPTVAIELELPAGRRLGSAVDVDGNRMVVSSPFADAGAARAGLVSVYERPDAASAWAPVSTITSPLPEVDGGFGDAVALRGNLLAIGESDRFGDRAEAGRVFVYELAEGTWAQVTGSPFSPGVAGDAFGASLAWIDDANLAVGAPYGNGGGAIGGGALWRVNVSVPSATNITPSGGLSPSAGDELGFSIDVTARPDPGVGGSWLVAGSPGFGADDGGAIYTLTLDGSAAVTGTLRGSGFSAGSRAGTAVAASGNRLVYGRLGGQGAGDTLTVAGREWVPDPDGAGLESAFWGDIPGFSTVHGAAIESQPNRYLDIEGATVVVGRPGGGGQVGVFRFDGRRIGPSPDDQLIPIGTVVGDRVGFAVALDGPTLVAGAPGVDATGVDAGGVYTVQVEQPATSYVGPDFGDWGNAANWDLGVPALDQQAIIPLERFASVNDVRVLDDLIVRGEVHINTNGELDVSSTLDIVARGGSLPASVDGEIVYVQPGGLLRLPPQNRIDGQLIVRNQVIAAGTVGVIGSGLISTNGEIVKQGTGALTIGAGLTWTSGATSVLTAEQGVIQFQGPYDFQGTTSIAAGAEVRFASPLGLVASSTIEVGITGDSSIPANYGRIVLAPGVAGTLNGTLRVGFVDFDPSPADSYPIITGCGFSCNDISGAFTSFETAFGDGVLDLVQVPDTSLELRVVENKLVSNDTGRTAFGTDIAIDGDLALIGDPNPSGLAGTAQIYERNVSTGEWARIYTHLDTGAARFGESVALGPDYYAVSNPTSGAVRVYRHSDRSLVGSVAGGSGDIAMSGDVLVVGRPVVPGSPTPQVDIYNVAASLATPVESFVATGAAGFGAAIDLADLGGGDMVLVVGAPDASGGSGAVHVFKRSAGTWETTVTDVLVSPQAAVGNRFGAAVAVAETSIVVGEPLSDLGAGDAGAVHVFDGQPGGYSLGTTLQAWDGPALAPTSSDTFGTSVSLDGDLLVVGAPSAQRFGIAKRDGAAYVFGRIGGVWTEQTQLRADDGFNGEAFGRVVAIADEHVLVGAPADNNNNGPAAGAVYSFDVAPPEIPPGLTFDFGVAAGSETVAVAGSIAVNDLDRRATTGTSAGSTLAAASLSSIRADDPQATALAQIAVGATPLSSIVLDSTPLSSIPLVLIEVDGGWPRILVGSELENEPFTSLTFGQVLAEGSATDASSPAGRFAATPLSSIDVDGTPLSSIPLSSIVLGATPLSSIPLSSIDGGYDWCVIVADLIPAGQTCDEALAQLTLLEVTLRGVPLSSIPLSSIPLSSIDLALSPLSSIPLSSIDLGRTPLSSIPLSSIPLSSIPLSSIDVNSLPLSSIPLSSIPLSSIPLSSIPLSSIPLSSIELVGTPLSSIATSIPLSSIPLSSIGPNGTPLSSIQLQGAPLSSIPLSSIVLADVPLSSIPLSSILLSSAEIGAEWCAVLAEADAGFDCTTGADPTRTTLRELSIRGVPLSSIPLSSIPLSSIDLANTPLSSIPLSSIPLSSIPLSSIPLSSIPLSSIDAAGTPLSSIPLSSIPLSSIDVAGSPLSSIPLSSIPLSSIPLSSIPLSSIPLSSIPLSSIPLSSITVGNTPLSSIPLSSIDVAGSPLSSIPLSSIPLSSIDCTRVDCQRGTLGDAAAAQAISGAATLGTVQPGAAGIRLGEIVEALLTVDRAALMEAIQLSQLHMGNLAGLDDLTLGDLPLTLTALADLELGDLGEALTIVTFADLLGASIIDSATGEPFNNLLNDLRAAIDASGDLGDLDYLGDLTLGDLLTGFTGTLSLLDIEPVLGFITVQTLLDALNITLTAPLEGTLGDLTEDEFGQLTLADLLQFAGDLQLGDLLDGIDAQLANYTLGDLLLALVDPASLSFSGVEFADVRVSALPPGTVPPTTLEAAFTMTSSTSRPVEVEVVMPTGAAFVDDSGIVGELVGGVGPALAERIDPIVDGNILRWSFTAEPDTDYSIEFDVIPSLRLGSTSLGGTARIAGTDIVVPATATVTVEEGLEPNDFPQVVPPALDDVVYLTYISTPTDNDVYAIDVDENDRLYVQLSNLDADLDLVLWGEPTNPGSEVPLAGTSSDAPLSPITNPDADGYDAEPLDDFRRLDQVLPDGAGLSLVDVSNRAGTATESFSTARLPAGRYYIQVYGSNGTTNVQPAALQIAIVEADERPECVAAGATPSTITPGVAPTLVGTNVNTVILVNESRLERFHGAAGRQGVVAALGKLVAYFADKDPSIVPAVVSVDGNQTVADAFQAWDTDTTCSPASANGVVAAINAEIIDPVRDQLDHVVILGADEQIPMARLKDSTLVANEYDYRHEFDGDLAGANPDGRNALTASFWESTILSDEPYGDSDARSLGDRYLYVTDIALGRVVETPDDIVSALDTFVQYDGTLAIDTAAVLGYDFLVDGSEQIAGTLNGALGSVDDSLADGLDADGRPWDRQAATTALAAAASNALISLNAHFDHYRALPAIGDKVPGFLDNLIAEDLAGDLGEEALLRSLVFSMGCHSGLSVSDITIAGTNADWAEVLGQQGALFVGNTGFGYGDTESVAYTELLMALFAEQVTAPLDLDPNGQGTSSTVGQALAWAKNEYVAGLQTFSVYDEKAVMESTFYGLPFYRVGIPNDVLDAVPQPPVNAPDANGELGVPVDANNAPTPTPTGTYYSNPDGQGGEQVIVAPGRPIQPKLVTDITVEGQVAHGAIVESMNSTYVDLPDPVIAQPIFDEAASQPEPEIGDVVFPTKPLDITTSTGPAGKRQQLVVATGQYRSDLGVQRLDDDIDVTVYYADPSEDDFTRPTISNVEGVIANGVLTVTLEATDTDGAVDRVVVLVAERPGIGDVSWTSIDLMQSGTTWSGTKNLAAGVADVELFVQAKDTAGNVGYATNKARNFGDTVVVAAPAPTDPAVVLDLTVDVDGTAGTNGWYSGSLTITPTGRNEISYFVDGVGPIPIASGGSFPISGGGPHSWTVVTDVGEVRSGQVKIDDDGAPVIDILTPTDGASYLAGTNVQFSSTCSDLSIASCVRRLNGFPIGAGSPLPTEPGAYTFSVTATDQVGNKATASRTFTIAPVTGPVIRTVTGPTTPQPIADGVSFEVLFSDVSGAADDYLATVDWGDGTSQSIEIALEDRPTATRLGRVAPSHTYTGPGVYTVTITIDDRSGDPGLVDVFEYEFVVIYDPGGGRVSGSGTFWSENLDFYGPRGKGQGTDVHFGYEARYKSGATVPSGRASMHRKNEFRFDSDRYDYLIINDSLAVTEGVGTLNGESGYRFRVQGADLGSASYFQITIWDPMTDNVVYDNGVLFEETDGVESTRVLLGGIRIRP